MDIFLIILCLVAIALSGFYLLGRHLDVPPPLGEAYKKLPSIPLGEMKPWRLFELGWPNNGGIKFVVVRPMEKPRWDIVPILGPGDNYYELNRSTPVVPLEPLT